jgi:hypothetical protein
MAVKSAAGKAAPHKITLPAFGLAEDILGTRDAVPGTRDLAPAAERHDIERLPDAAGPDVAHDSELHLVTFHLDAEEYGVDIGRVQEIIRVGHITGVPNSPEFIRGVINLRGKIIPVIDLRKRMALPDATVTKMSRSRGG